MTAKIQTTMTVFRVGAEPEAILGDLEKEPGYAVLRTLVEPLVGGRFVHVSVLHEGKRTDMFVHETGAIDGMPRNERATQIYRNNWMTQYPETDPEKLPAIYGPAVLFSRRVWF